MRRVKFPRTRRDRFQDRRRRPSHFSDFGDVEPKRTNIYNPRKLRFSTIQSQPEQTGKYTLDKYLAYSGTYQHPPGHAGDPMFPAESQMPLATNAESWGNLALGMSTPRNLSRNMTEGSNQGSLPSLSASQTGRKVAMEEDEDEDDEVFVPNPMDRWREGDNMESFPSMDTVDQGSQTGGATGIDMFYCCFGIATYLVDIATDLFLAFQYLSLGHYFWFALTLGFFFVPSLIMSIFSLILYLRDWRIVGESASGPRWASRAFCMLFLMAPLIRMIESTYYAHKSRTEKDVLKRREYYDRWLDEDTDSTLLRLVEAFLEAAPQLVLQIYIITKIGTDGGGVLILLQVLGILSSWLTITGTIVNFQKSLRLSQPKKGKLKTPGLSAMFFWRLFTIASRVLAMALFASQFQWAVFGVVGGHWLVMLIWIIMQDTDYCKLVDRSGKEHTSPVSELGFRIVTSFIHIFVFLNLIEGHSRLRCVIFYVVVYVENVAMVMTWYFVASKAATITWYFAPALILVLLGFWIGIFFQVLYYKFYHPNNISVLHVRKRIKWCVPCSELFVCKEEEEGPDHAAASEKVLNNKADAPLQSSTPAPSMYSYQPSYKQNHPIQTSTPAPSVYSYNSPERPVQMVHPQSRPPPQPQYQAPPPHKPPPQHHQLPHRPPPQQKQHPPQQQPHHHQPPQHYHQPPPHHQQQPQHPHRPPPQQRPPPAQPNRNTPQNNNVVFRGPVTTSRTPAQPKETPSPIHGPYHTPYVSKTYKTKPFSPPNQQVPSPVKSMVSAPPRQEAEESTEEPLPQSARASLAQEVPVNYSSQAAAPSRHSSTGHTTTTSEDITMSSSEDLINQPTVKIVNPALPPGKKPGVVPIKRAATLPQTRPAPTRVSIRPVSDSRALQSSQDEESESDSETGSETDEEIAAVRPISRAHSVTFGPPPDVPTGRTDEVIVDPTKKRPRPITPGGRPRSPRDLSRRPGSPRNPSYVRPRSPKSPSWDRPKSPRDFSSSGRRSPRDPSFGRPKSPRDMSNGRPKSPRSASYGERPKSPKNPSYGERPKSPREFSDRPKSPRDMSSGRPRSPREVIPPRPRSPREISGAPYPRIPMEGDNSVFRPVPQRAAPGAGDVPQPSLAYPAPEQEPLSVQQKPPRQRTPRNHGQHHTPSSRGPGQTSSGSKPSPTRQPVQKGPPRKRSSPNKPSSHHHQHRAPSGRSHHKPPQQPFRPDMPGVHPGLAGLSPQGPPPPQGGRPSPRKPTQGNSGNETTV